MFPFHAQILDKLIHHILKIVLLMSRIKKGKPSNLTLTFLFVKFPLSYFNFGYNHSSHMKHLSPSLKKHQLLKRLKKMSLEKDFEDSESY